jgi:hypothetical protein
MFADLGRRLDLAPILPGDLDPATACDDDLLELLAAKGRMPLDELRAAGTGVVAEGAVHGWVLEQVLPDGRFRVAPEPLLAQLRDAVSRLSVGPAALDSHPRPLVMIPRRLARTMNSQLRDVTAKGDNGGVRLNPLDAAERGIVDGGDVRVTSLSTAATVCGTAVVDAHVARGAISVTHGWATPNAGSLTSSEHDIDPLTGMVLQSGVPVTVTPARGKRRRLGVCSSTRECSGSPGVFQHSRVFRSACVLQHSRVSRPEQPVSPPGEAEHPFGDDVALDLTGAAGDGQRERPEVLLEPARTVAQPGAQVGRFLLVAVQPDRAE